MSELSELLAVVLIVHGPNSAFALRDAAEKDPEGVKLIAQASLNREFIEEKLRIEAEARAPVKRKKYHRRRS